MNINEKKQLTFEEVKIFAAGKGAELTRESETSFRRNGRYTNTITDTWYKLSTTNQKFTLLTDVRDFLNAA
jgi:hypothetical protein